MQDMGRLLSGPIEVYTGGKAAMEEMASEDADRAVVLGHTLFNALLLNSGLSLALIAGDLHLVFAALLMLILMGGWTFAAILGIEAVTYYVAKRQGGQGKFWSQLSITNMYLTPVFLVFFLVFAVSPFLPDGLEMGLDFIAAPVVALKNSEKIMAAHKLESTTITSIAYGLSVVAAYVVWAVLLLLPLILLG